MSVPTGIIEPVVIDGEACRIETAPFWSEKPLLSALGVPGVYFADSGKVKFTGWRPIGGVIRGLA